MKRIQRQRTKEGGGMKRWFRVDHKSGWTGKEFTNGRWHLLVVRDRFDTGRRYFGAACGPVPLRPSRNPSFRRPRVLRRSTPASGEACPRCLRYRIVWVDPVRRPFHIRRTVCGRGCGGWTPRTVIAGEPMPCGGYHRNKRLFCEADAKWAITANRLFRGGPLPIRTDEPPTTFFRCTKCAGIYRMAPEWFTCERLMADPPKELIA